MWKLLSVVCLAGVLALASPTGERAENSARPIHIIKPPVRCPEGMKPDANGRCRVVWERRAADVVCPDGRKPDDDGFCQDQSAICTGDDCLPGKRLEKRDAEANEPEDRTEAFEPLSRHRRTEAPKGEKRSKRRSDAGDAKAAKQARSKHAFIMMLKKKMQMMKPKPPHPPPPPHHHPPHHSQETEEEEEPEEEAPAEEPEQPAARLFFGDEACVEKENSTGGCREDAEMLPDEEANKEFKEWKPEKSSESSESSDSSSSSDSAGESESEGGSGDSEDEVLEKAIKIKLMKLFRMKQRYGPALRRWLADRLREYEDSFDD